MLKYIEVTGKTEDEAITRGLLQLGMDRDDVSVEVLHRGKAGFLGIGSVPARVKLTYEAPDEPEPVPQPESEAEKPAPAPAPKPETPAHEAPAPRPEKKDRRPREKKPQPAPQPQPRAEAPVPAAPAPVGEPVDDEVAAAIVRFQAGLFEQLGVKAVPTVTRTEDAYQVVLEGDDLGPLIGHRGETLDAIQQLTSYAVNRGRSRRVRIHVDAEGYRARREESLNRLARKTAAKVVKYRRNITLEPMNAYERHVIHTALQDFPGVSTHSVGTEPNRRTVVTYDPNA